MCELTRTPPTEQAAPCGVGVETTGSAPRETRATPLPAGRGRGKGNNTKRKRGNRERGLSRSNLKIDSQNFNGLGTTSGGEFGKIEEQLQEMKIDGGAYAMLIQETKRYGPGLVKFGEHLLLLNGQERPKGDDGKRCRSGGVGILLSMEAEFAWRKSGSWMKCYGNSVMAIKMVARAFSGRKQRLHLVTSYAPDSSKSRREKEDHLRQLQACISDSRSEEMLVIGTDANVRLGGENGLTVGHFGVSAGDSDSAHKHDASRVLTLLATNRMCSAATFYPARLGVGHSTYYSSTGRGFQLDHIFIRRRDLVKTIFAGKLQNAGPVMSDHSRLRLELRHTFYGRKKQDCKKIPDYTVLFSNEDEDACVQRKFESVFNASCRRQSLGSIPSVAAIVAAAAEAVEVLPKVEKTSILKDWYDARKEELNALRTNRNAAQVRLRKARATRSANEAELREKLRLSRVRYMRAQHAARRAWNDKLAQRLGPSGQDDMTKQHNADGWKVLKSLQTGPDSGQKVIEMRMQDPSTGKLCSTLDASAKLWTEHVRKHHAGDDLSVKARIRGLPQWQGGNLQHLANALTGDELKKAAQKQRSNRAKGSDGISMSVWKFLLKRRRANTTITAVFAQIWCSGSYPGEHVCMWFLLWKSNRRGKAKCSHRPLARMSVHCAREIWQKDAGARAKMQKEKCPSNGSLPGVLQCISPERGGVTRRVGGLLVCRMGLRRYSRQLSRHE